jgi:hypothetical protein
VLAEGSREVRRVDADGLGQFAEAEVVAEPGA